MSHPDLNAARDVHTVLGMTTQTTLGSLIATLFEEYERRYHDPRVAAIATQLALVNLSTPRTNGNASTWESLQAAGA